MSSGSAMNPVVRYTLLRLALFVGLLAVGWLAGARGALLLVGAAAVSAVVSWAVLGRQRAAMIGSLQDRAEARRRRAEQRTAREDAWDDAQRAGEQ